MKRIIRIRNVFILVFMMCIMSIPSYAEELTASPVPDYHQKGSVTVEILSSDTGAGIPGGTLTLYQVASAVWEEGDNVFRLTDDFLESGISLAGINEEDAGAAELASALEVYANTRQIAGDALTVDKNGQAQWRELELGVYLVVNTAAAEGYAPIPSFLVTVPRYLDGSYVYDVTANPKSEAADAIPPETPDSGTPDSETPKPGTKTPVPGGKLPQTGQLWWPVPILTIAGLLFLMLGWYKRRKFKNQNALY